MSIVEQEGADPFIFFNLKCHNFLRIRDQLDVTIY